MEIGSHSNAESGQVSSTGQCLTVIVNGEPRQLADGVSVAGLLADLNLAVGHVAVEVNLELVPRAQHSRQRLADGDRVEIVTLVGGG